VDTHTKHENEIRYPQTNKKKRYTATLVIREMATHSSVLAWRIPGTTEPGGLQSMGLKRVGHD